MHDRQLNIAERTGISYRMRKALELIIGEDSGAQIVKVYVRASGACRIYLDLSPSVVEQLVGGGDDDSR